MKKSILALCLAVTSLVSVSAQDNMEAFRHISIGAEAGLHGFGVEIAMPIQKHFVLKAGYNWMPSGDLFNTNLTIDTKDLRQAQESIESATSHTFTNKFGDESVVNAGLQVGLTNLKAMINWYPFASGRFYISGGVYYTPNAKQDDAFIKLSGNTTENDWAALKELNDYKKDHDPSAPESEIALKIGNESYAVREIDGKGNMTTEFKMDPLKYYVGMGVGRCIPNRFMGLQLELGAMIYHNSVLKCQDKEVGSITDAASNFGSDAEEILQYVDKYPIYPQLTLRLSFRLF
jgi:hypothetical protein